MALFSYTFKDDLLHFFDDANVIVHEAGAGLIHTEPEDLIPYLKDDHKLFWMHTAKTNENGFSRGYILEKDQNIIIA